MKRYLVLVLAAVVLAGCTTTQKGTGVGAGAGALIGGIIGHQSGDMEEGAALGAAIGGVGGYAAGRHMQQNKFCPVCGRVYGDVTQQYCPHDGTELLNQVK